jgi:hypothetical protein
MDLVQEEDRRFAGRRAPMDRALERRRDLRLSDRDRAGLLERGFGLCRHDSSQRGLARAWRRLHHRELARAADRERRVQAVARHQPRAGQGRMQLRGYNDAAKARGARRQFGP